MGGWVGGWVWRAGMTHKRRRISITHEQQIRNMNTHIRAHACTPAPVSHAYLRTQARSPGTPSMLSCHAADVVTHITSTHHHSCLQVTPTRLLQVLTRLVALTPLEDLSKLSIGDVVDVQLQEAAAEGARQRLAASVCAGRVLVTVTGRQEGRQKGGREGGREGTSSVRKGARRA